MNNGNIIIYDNNSLLSEHVPCNKSKCDKVIDKNVLLSLANNNVIIKTKETSSDKNQPCNKKRPCIKEENKCDDVSDDECESDYMSFTSASSYTSFDSFDENDEQLLEHEINRSRVLIKQKYNNEQH